ncbi:hypothetical protein KSP40_PGU011507 [Platanthera guangdongensis]|uniref:Pentatricopeptide repeat-containing protein n=1 Tax=Platanthera guangdongensis TaxID=2320717 RepID=A0ABR2N5X8_9ASPA
MAASFIVCLGYNRRLPEACKYAEDMIDSGIKLQSSTLSKLRSSLQQLVIDRSGASSPKPPKARKVGGSSPVPLGIVLLRPWRSSVMEEKLSGASNSRVGAGSVRGQQPRSLDVEPLHLNTAVFCEKREEVKRIAQTHRLQISRESL